MRGSSNPADVPIEAELARLGFASATAADYAEHRLGLGIADTAEIGGEVCYPLEANFEILHGVDFKKGCYVGQELTARMKLKGELRKRILPVSGSAPLPSIGTQVTADGTALGPLIAASGTRGLALLRLDRLADAKEEAIRVQDIQLTVIWRVGCRVKHVATQPGTPRNQVVSCWFTSPGWPFRGLSWR